ncbi:hypothetical protein AB4141_24650, partial [Cupriavidus sp. 2KB_15]|uniref:hypothetical protein n=1 Tax=Cupriavidus sp. 2KB_15 TaxID=3232976 RepID=UPI003F9040C7
RRSGAAEAAGTILAFARSKPTRTVLAFAGGETALAVIAFTAEAAGTILAFARSKPARTILAFAGSRTTRTVLAFAGGETARTIVALAAETARMVLAVSRARAARRALRAVFGFLARAVAAARAFLCLLDAVDHGPHALAVQVGHPHRPGSGGLAGIASGCGLDAQRLALGRSVIGHIFNAGRPA